MARHSSPSRTPRKKKGPRLLWFADPWKTLDVARDTTVRLAEACEQEGIESGITDFSLLHWSAAEPKGARVQFRNAAGLIAGEAELSAWNQIHYRVDPPVGAEYLAPLAALTAAGVSDRVVNPMESIVFAGTKLLPQPVLDLGPSFILSSDWSELKAWGQTHGRTVLKPLHDAASRGIERHEWLAPGGTERARESLQKATLGWTRPILLTRYLPEIEKGELRTWWLDGVCIGSLVKYPLAGDFKVNVDQGSRLGPGAPSAAQKRRFGAIARLLRQWGVRLAAVDWIGECVTDVNITSPGLLRQLEELSAKPLARTIVRQLVRKKGPVRRA